MGSGASGTIGHHVTPPLAPRPPRPPGRRSKTGGRDRKNFGALCALFFCPAMRGRDDDPTGKRPHEPPQGKDNAMNEVALDPRQAPARAELLLGADFGQQAAGRKLGAVRTRRLAVSEAADRPSGSACGKPLGGARGLRPGRPHRRARDRQDRCPRRPRMARLPGGAGRGRHLRPVDRARPGPRGAGARRAAGGPLRQAPRPRCARPSSGGQATQRGSDHAVACRPEDRAAERSGETPVSGSPAAVAASPRAERRPRMTPLAGNRDARRVAAGRPA